MHWFRHEPFRNQSPSDENIISKSTRVKAVVLALNRSAQATHNLQPMVGLKVEESCNEGPTFAEVKPNDRFNVDFQGLNAFVTDDRKQVLHNVCGSAQSGRVLAIMGPTGCGKSTLLNVLSGRFDGERQGDVLFNGRNGGSYLKSHLAYVTQDDVLPSALTVQEILEFHCRLRVKESRELCTARVAHSRSLAAVDWWLVQVERLITLLGLTHCRNTAVFPSGGGRGVSGGERKRISIACEMVSWLSLISHAARHISHTLHVTYLTRCPSHISHAG